jgi:hypothetical protein
MSISFTIPNLADQNPKDLDEAATLFFRLFTYCTHKANAMRARAAGMALTAMELERRCDVTYATLPASLGMDCRCCHVEQPSTCCPIHAPYSSPWR